jgi:hypothetical protein
VREEEGKRMERDEAETATGGEPKLGKRQGD